MSEVIATEFSYKAYAIEVHDADKIWITRSTWNDIETARLFRDRLKKDGIDCRIVELDTTITTKRKVLE